MLFLRRRKHTHRGFQLSSWAGASLLPFPRPQDSPTLIDLRRIRRFYKGVDRLERRGQPAAFLATGASSTFPMSLTPPRAVGRWPHWPSGPTWHTLWPRLAEPGERYGGSKWDPLPSGQNRIWLGNHSTMFIPYCGKIAIWPNNNS